MFARFRVSPGNDAFHPGPAAAKAEFSPPPKRRKSGVRQPLSCVECRNRKSKCDRKLPCQSCTRRGEGALCSYEGCGSAQRQAMEQIELRQRIQMLEAQIQELASRSQKNGTGPNDPAASIPWSPASVNDESRSNSDTPNSTGSLEKNRDGSVVYDNHSGWDSVLYELSDIKMALRNTWDNGPLDSTGQRPAFSHSLKKTASDNSQWILQLPTKHLMEYLISRYLAVFSNVFHVLHEPTFREEYRKFCAAPKDTSLTWLGLLYVVMGLAVLSLDDDDAVLKENSHMGVQPMDCMRRYNELAMECLEADGFMEKCGLTTVQCLILIIYCKSHTENSRVGWALLGMTINLATSIGCHRDGLTLRLNPVETEQRRRCWAALLMLESLQTSAFGRPSMMRTYTFDTQLPLDVNDVDITHSGVHQPSSKPTQMTYLNLKFRLLGLTSKIHELNFTNNTAGYRAVLDLDEEIEKEQTSWPARYSSGKADSAIAALHENDQVHWYILHGHLYQMFLLLHRPFFYRSGQAETYAVSERRCEEAAVSIIEIFEILNKEPKYQPYRWYTNGLASFHAFHAAIVIFARCLRDVGDPTKQERFLSGRDRLAKLRELFMAIKHRSPTADKALPVMDLLRDKIDALGVTTLTKSAVAPDASVPAVEFHALPSPTIDGGAISGNGLSPLCEWLESPQLNNMTHWISPHAVQWDQIRYNIESSFNFVPIHGTAT